MLSHKNFFILIITLTFIGSISCFIGTYFFNEYNGTVSSSFLTIDIIIFIRWTRYHKILEDYLSEKGEWSALVVLFGNQKLSKDEKYLKIKNDWNITTRRSFVYFMTSGFIICITGQIAKILK